MARKWKKEDELRQIAEKISSEIVIRSYQGGNSYDKRREATASERVFLYNIAYGALLGLNYGDENRSSPVAERAIVDTAEIMAKLFLPQCNGYDSMYVPLNQALAEWEKDI